LGDAYWDLPWASGVNPHADPGLIEAQARHAAALARRWRGREELIAWDLTDEPPFWIHCATTTDADARRWTDAVTTALRENDPGHLVTIGTASQEVDGGPFRADVAGDRPPPLRRHRQCPGGRGPAAQGPGAFRPDAPDGAGQCPNRSG